MLCVVISWHMQNGVCSYCYVSFFLKRELVKKWLLSPLFVCLKITILRLKPLKFTCVCTWHNILLPLVDAFCVSDTAASFGLIVWSFVIFRRWCAATQLSQMNSEHSTHHDVAFASSAQLLHLMISCKMEMRERQLKLLDMCRSLWMTSVKNLMLVI